jgi:hypothetical protein
MDERCQWQGCTNAALPNLPPGQGVCADHLDAATKYLEKFTRRLNVTITAQQHAINGPQLPLWRKPGRWVPWILFVVWLVMTVWYPTQMMWWFIFMPIAWIGWQFGMNHTGSRE